MRHFNGGRLSGLATVLLFPLLLCGGAEPKFDRFFPLDRLDEWMDSPIPQGLPNPHLQNVTQRTWMDLSCRGIADLTPLAAARGLKHLDLANISVESAETDSPLTAFPFNRTVANRVRDLTPLAGLPLLEVLNLDGNLVRDISPLLDLPALVRVHLEGNPLDPATAPAVIDTLRERGVAVYLDSVPEFVWTIDPVTGELLQPGPDFILPAEWIELQRLDQEALRAEPPLEAGPQVEGVSDPILGSWLARRFESFHPGCELAEFPPPDCYPTMQYFCADCAGISRLEGLRQFSGLRWLYFGNKCARNWRGPFWYETDSLHANRISDISELSALHELVELDLSGNLVTDIEPLMALENLSLVILSGNPLSDESVRNVEVMRQRGVAVVVDSDWPRFRWNIENSD